MCLISKLLYSIHLLTFLLPHLHLSMSSFSKTTTISAYHMQEITLDAMKETEPSQSGSMAECQPMDQESHSSILSQGICMG